MFTTVERVKGLTGYDVTLETIGMAQGIIEAFIGRVEVEIEDPTDRMQLEKAVSYQAAYMRDNFARVFEQVGVKQIAQSDGLMSLHWENAAPFIAPLAFLTLKNLSWRGIRSVHTGPMTGSRVQTEGWAAR